MSKVIQANPMSDYISDRESMAESMELDEPEDEIDVVNTDPLDGLGTDKNILFFGGFENSI